MSKTVKGKDKKAFVKKAKAKRGRPAKAKLGRPAKDKAVKN